MKPNVDVSNLKISELIQRFSRQKTSAKRFNVDMPEDVLCQYLHAAYFAEVNNNRGTMKEDPEVMAHIKTAAQWLGDPDGKFGLMLTGLYGNGKTTLMLAICNLVNYLFHSTISNQVKHFKWIRAKEVTNIFMQKDPMKELKELANVELLAIDDVGSEPPVVMNFGMSFTPMTDLLEARYQRRRMTIITTNLVQNRAKGISQISDHYGERIVDRLREMMKIITFKNDSFRGK